MSSLILGAAAPEEAYNEFYKDCEINSVYALQRLLTDDFTLTHMGRQQNKSDFSLNVSTGALNAFKTVVSPALDLLELAGYRKER